MVSNQPYYQLVTQCRWFFYQCWLLLPDLGCIIRFERIVNMFQAERSGAFLFRANYIPKISLLGTQKPSSAKNLQVVKVVEKMNFF